MSDKHSRQLPQEVLGLLSTVLLMPATAVILVLSAMLLPSITSLRGVGTTRLFWLGLTAGMIGIVLLFFARLPLYRQRRFWTFGPRELDNCHRRLYWLAYVVVLVSIGLLGIVWFRLG